MQRYALVHNGGVRRVALRSPHPSALPVEFPELPVGPDTHHITLNPIDQWEVHPDKVVATYTLTERDFEAEEAARLKELRERRAGMVVTRLQARRALRETGLLETIENMMADPETDDLFKDAWLEAGEWRRTSPTMLAMAKMLELSDEQLDEIFERAAEITDL